MKAAFGCEVTGQPSEVLWRRNLRRHRPWVTEIVGRDELHGVKRRFLDGKNDYNGVNKRDTRGAVRWFTLESGRLYEACTYVGWCEMQRCFVTVDPDRGDVVEVPAREVPAWLDRLFGPAVEVPQHTTIRRA